MATKEDLKQLIVQTLPVADVTEDQFAKMVNKRGLDQAVLFIKRQAHKKISGIRNDIGLRFQEGFLEAPDVRQKLVEKSIAKKFPNQDVKVNMVGNDFVFSIGGSGPIALDPSAAKGGDVMGELAEQVGRFIEPTADIAVGALTLNPFAVAGTAGGFQTAREILEQKIDPTRQSATQQASDVLNKALLGGVTEGIGTAIAGKAASMTGAGARERTRQLGGVTTRAAKEGESAAQAGVGQTVKNAGHILAEKSTRKIEKGILEGFESPEARKKIVGVLQRRANKLVNSYTGRANKSFKFGRQLAEVEGPKFGVDIADDVADLMKNISGSSDIADKFGRELSETVIDAATKVGKEGDVLTLNAASPNEVIKLREFLVDQIGINGKNPAFNKEQAVALKTKLNTYLDNLASQGSDAAAMYKRGVDNIREVNTIFPEALQRKFIGRTAEYPSGFDPVTPGELLDKFSSKAFDERELLQLRDVTGISASPALEKKTGKALLADIIETRGKPEGTEELGFLRLNELPDEVVGQAEKFRNFPELEAAQEAGFEIDPQMFDRYVTAPNTKQGGRSFNFRSVDQFIGGRRGSTAAEILGGQTGQEGVDLVSQTAGRERIMQGKILPFTNPDASAIGRNVLPVSLPGQRAAQGFLESTVFTPEAQRGLFTLTGQASEQVPQAIKMLGGASEGARNLIQGQATQDPTEAEMEEAIFREIMKGGLRPSGGAQALFQ